MAEMIEGGGQAVQLYSVTATAVNLHANRTKPLRAVSRGCEGDTLLAEATSCR